MLRCNSPEEEKERLRWEGFAEKEGILNRQSRAERQNTFDWRHILLVRVTIN